MEIAMNPELENAIMDELTANADLCKEGEKP